jgi:hypothetical protein
MDISAIIARLQATDPTLFAQILEAQPSGSVVPEATQAAMYTLLQGLVAGRMYPVQLPEVPVHPSIVYQLVSSAANSLEGYDIARTDVYVLNLRGVDYDALLALANSVVGATVGTTVEVTDMLHDYDQAENLFRINLELTYSYISAASQALPVAYVYPLTRDADPSAYDNLTKQFVAEVFTILIVTADGNITALQDEVQAALLGWQQSTAHYEIEYNNGASIEGVGSLEMWREVYRDAFYMTEV